MTTTHRRTWHRVHADVHVGSMAADTVRVPGSGTTEGRDAIARLVHGRTWVEHLNVDDCWTLIGAVPVGRLGVLVDSAPEIYPVNHVVDGHSIVFRTDVGSKLYGLLRSPAVCYEVDDVDPVARTGWSVLVKGRAEELHDLEDRPRAVPPLEVWATGARPHWIRIVPDEVTGRRIWHGDQMTTTPRQGRETDT